MSFVDGHSHAAQADVSVRPAQAADTATMGAIQVASWQATHAHELGPEVVAAFDPAQFAAAWADALERYGTSPVHRLLVACAGPQVVGFAATQPSPDPDARGENDDGDDGGQTPDAETANAHELTALFVDPDHWREGHGSRLLAACCDLARESGGSEMRCWVSGADSARAAFLESAGFALDGAWRTSEIDEERTLTERRYSAAIA